jgi:hypothetical protein
MPEEFKYTIDNSEEKNETLTLIDRTKKIETYKELNSTKTQINIEHLKENVAIKQVKISELKDTPLYMS